VIIITAQAAWRSKYAQHCGYLICRSVNHVYFSIKKFKHESEKVTKSQQQPVPAAVRSGASSNSVMLGETGRSTMRLRDRS
jgi:hypothetical protein